ncbi:Minf_1886 family protein [Candidatus Laterigemmans baculatus]|uniref:Minf_1886 family protein n=1 Tax=Candidatus Laterigemmans baculatus TaxID=2770505 RepID=UPI0013D93031|nr:Minf_1886 family protein [Candidatus Laterigemmans baculatus]
MNAAQRAMERLLRRDTRYKLEAYVFVRDALAYAHRTMAVDPSAGPEEEDARHLSGQQLCEACRLYALDQFGYLARIVLASWGLKSTSDFGEVVYNLIEIKHMRKSDTDRREDFDNVYAFEEAFEPKFELLSPEEA